MVVLGYSTTRGRRSFPPSARLELLLGRVRRRLGRHRRGKPSVRSLDSKPKGTLHQPQGDDGSAERPLRVQLSSQRQDDRSLLRQCHDSRLPQAIRRHEVSGPVPQSKGDSPVSRIHGDHATSPVLPGVCHHESGSSQSAQPGDRIGMDATPGGGPRSSPPVAGDHTPVRDLADSKAPTLHFFLAFPWLFFCEVSCLFSACPSCSWSCWSLGALLPRSNLRFPPRWGPPFAPRQLPFGVF